MTKNYTIYRVATFKKTNFQVFQDSSRFLKVRIFGSIFSLKLNLRLKTKLKSIKTLNNYYKATLTVFFNKKKFDDEKKNIYRIDFLC